MLTAHYARPGASRSILQLPGITVCLPFELSAQKNIFTTCFVVGGSWGAKQEVWGGHFVQYLDLGVGYWVLSKGGGSPPTPSPDLKK